MVNSRSLSQRCRRQTFGGYNGIRVGEASHPGPRRARRLHRSLLQTPLKIWTINTGGAPKAWQIFSCLRCDSNDTKSTEATSASLAPGIIAIQEAAFSDNEFTAFTAEARKFGYHAFHSGAEPVANSRRMEGGAVFLVRRDLPCRLLWKTKSSGGAALAVWIGHVLFLSVYLPPRPESCELVDEVTALVSTLPPRQIWLMGADFNAAPQENPFQYTLNSVGYQMSYPPNPTRWEGKRILDYCLGNVNVQQMTTLDFRLSDHKIVEGFLNLQFRNVDAYELAPVPAIKTIKVDEGKWEQAVNEAWRVTHTPLTISPDIDHNWESLSSDLWKTLILAYQNTHQDSRFPGPLMRKGKPVSVSVRKMEFTIQRSDGCFATSQFKSLQNLNSRLLEVQRRGWLLSEVSNHDRCLDRKIRRNPHFDPNIGLTPNIQRAKKLLEKCEETETRTRIRTWSQKMSEDKAALAWLRRKPQYNSIAVRENADGTPATSVQGAIANIIAFWRTIWCREPLQVDSVWQTVQEFVPLSESQQWAPLSGAHLRKAAYESRNRAAGIDGWTAFELSLFSTAMWDAVADFYNHHCLRYGRVPEIWTHFRQVQIGKEHGCSEDGSLRADQLRPISVSSLMWRVCQKAQFCHSDAQLWINQTFPEYFIGGIKGRGTDQAISRLLFRAQQGWHVATLDLAKAFDRTSPRMAGLILKQLGMSLPVLNLVLNVWENQKRWVQYCGETYPVPQLVQQSLPQGDSWLSHRRQ